MLTLLLTACSDPALDTDDGAPPDTEPTETIDGTELPPARTLDAPGLMNLSCSSAIPDIGKTDCAAEVTWPDGAPLWTGTAGVGVRGRSSAGFPKQQYSVELRVADGTDAKVGLFGLPDDGDWVLNGMYLDRALLRSRLSFDVFRALSGAAGWAPQGAYLELTVNTDYRGVYFLSERVERGGGRLPMEVDDGAGSRWIVQADDEGIPSTLQYASWALEYPDPTPPVVDAVAAEIATIEALLVANDPAVWNHLDLDSFVSFLIVEEFAKNNDGFYLSHHMWRGDDGKVRLVPWDLDLTFGQPNYNENWRSDTWIAYRSEFVALAAAQPAFEARLAELWAAARAGVLSNESVLARMDAYRALIGDDAIGRNFARWPIDAIQFGANELYPVASAEEEYELVRAWALARLAWMDENIGSY